MAERVAIIGGGLAGLAAAQALAEQGYAVTLFESRNRLGGRAGSFVDQTSGQIIDACQHVSMGCCTAFAHFARTVGISYLLAPQPALWFQTPDGRRSEFRPDRLMAPFHIVRPFWKLHTLSLFEKLRVAWGVACLVAESPESDPPLKDWLISHWQTPRTIERFWGVILVSALNETVDRLGLKYARKVIVESFLAGRDAGDVHVPRVPLDRLYGEELQKWLADHQVDVRLGAGVKSVEPAQSHGQPIVVSLRNGERHEFDRCVVAVPFDRLTDLWPGGMNSPLLDKLKQLAVSPITSVHLWYDQPVLDVPHLVLVDCHSQWVFSRGQVAPGEWYVQVVVSAAHDLRELGNEAIAASISGEIASVLGIPAGVNRIRTRVVTEHAATFSAVPGVDGLRPGPDSGVAGLVLAGDWTATGWPATMEGAVRSGYAAADHISRTPVAFDVS